MNTTIRPTRLAAVVVATVGMLAAAVLVAAPATASPTDVKIDGVVYTYDPAVSANEVKVTDYSPAVGQTTVTIKATLDIAGSPKPVTVINDGVFENFNLTKVTFLGTNLAAIGKNAFMNTDLPTVTLPAGLLVIREKAFFGNQLATVTIPNSVSIIGDAAFELNTSLKKLVLGNHVTLIGKKAFQATALQQVTIPNSVSIIDDQAFIESSLTSVVLGDHVAIIGENAFDDQSGPLKSVRFLGMPPTNLGTGNTADESFDTSGGYPAVTFPAPFQAPGYPGGFTKPTWKGYNTSSVAPYITGTFREGYTLSTNPARANSTLTFKWYANGALVQDGASDKLLLGRIHAGRRISVAVLNGGVVVGASTKTTSIGSPYKRLVLSSFSVRKGQALVVSATGLKPYQKAKIKLNGKTRWSGKADANGNVTKSVTFKSNTKSGQRSVKVTAKKSKGKPKYSISTKVTYTK